MLNTHSAEDAQFLPKHEFCYNKVHKMNNAERRMVQYTKKERQYDEHS